MKKNLVHYILAIILVVVGLTGCAASHAKHRGSENAPFQRIEPLRVDPNQIKHMSAQEFDEYMRRLRTYNNHVRDTAYANGYYAYSEKQWHSDVEGGPPAPPNVASRGGSGRGSKKEPTIASMAWDTAKKETSNVVRDSMRTTSREVQNTIRTTIRGFFD